MRFGPGLLSSKDLTGWRDRLQGGSLTWLVLAVGRGPQFCSIQASPQGCLSVLTPQQLASSWLQDDPREPGRSHNVFYGPALEVHSIQLVTQTRADWMWEETTQNVKITRVILEAGDLIYPLPTSSPLFIFFTDLTVHGFLH